MSSDFWNWGTRTTQIDWAQALEWKFYFCIVCPRMSQLSQVMGIQKNAAHSTRSIVLYPTLKMVAPPLIAMVS